MATKTDDAKLIDEFRIEECIVYYGFYNIALATQNDYNGSVSLRKSISRSSIISSLVIAASPISKLKSLGESTANVNSINEEACLTIYSKLTKNVYCVKLESKEKAQAWYYTLFKLAFFPDSWTHFGLDHLPTLKPKVSVTVARSKSNLSDQLIISRQNSINENGNNNNSNNNDQLEAETSNRGIFHLFKTAAKPKRKQNLNFVLSC